MRALEAWERFVSRRVDARPLALFRIIVGAAAFLKGLATARLLDRLLVEGAVRGRSYLWVPELTEDLAGPIIALWLTLSVMTAIGLWTRTSAAGLALLGFYQLLADQNLYSNHLYLLTLFLFLLAASDSGADLSVDWLRRGRPRATVCLWATTLIRIQMSLVYFYTATAKMNSNFLSGYVLEQVFVIPEAWKIAWLLRALAWLTPALEFALAFGLWIPRVRPIVAVGGLLFHALIPLLMRPYAVFLVFSAISTGSYLLFFDSSLSHRLLRAVLPRRLERIAARGGSGAAD